MKWTNGQLEPSNNPNAYKPGGGLVFNLSGSIQCVVLIAEFKPSEQNSYVESDFVKLGRHMEITLNNLVFTSFASW
ncbi:hypothetical protein BDF21DRAFT_342369 [Thamnidium elegans]|nr:hypothetical protein BDF21DRAFT_342369 [Thamnidium elegans]